MNKPSKVRLTTITPLHIGAGDELTAMEFAHLNDGRYCVVNQTELFRALKGKGLLDSLLGEVEKEEFTLTEFLRDNNLLDEEFLKGIGYFLSNPQSLKPKRIRPFIRNPYSQPYIPGTAIKGAIRSAVLFCLLKEIKDKMSEPEYEEFLNRLVNLSKGRKKVAERLVNEFLKNYALPETERFSAHTDIFRALKVSDSKPFDKKPLVLEEIRIIELNPRDPKGWNFSKTIYAECIPEGETLELGLYIDDEVLKEFKDYNKEKKIPFANISEEILKKCKHFSEQIIASNEKPFFNQLKEVDSITTFYNNESPDLRVGWGSGLGETTVYTLLTEDLKKEVVKKYFPKSHYPDFPKTRRVIVRDGRPHQPLGWVRLEVKRDGD